MFTVKEMREFLAKEYGITTDEELDKELKKKGGIRIGIFTDPKINHKEECIHETSYANQFDEGSQDCRETA